MDQALMKPYYEHNGSKVLVGKKAIKSHLGLNDDATFHKWIKKGLPALCEDGRWYAHKENIDRFFQARTNILTQDFPEDAD
jgi:hypothetical protein